MSHAHPEATTTTAPAEQRLNHLAVWSLVLAILTLGGIGSVLAVVLGTKARRQVQQTGERGAGVALAGVVVGVITLVLAVLYWAVIATHTGRGSGGGGGGGGGGTGGGGTGY